MPCKLFDASPNLTHMGEVTMENGSQAEEIRATYNPVGHDNRSTQEIWCYYFDKNDSTFYGA